MDILLTVFENGDHFRSDKEQAARIIDPEEKNDRGRERSVNMAQSGHIIDVPGKYMLCRFKNNAHKKGSSYRVKERRPFQREDGIQQGDNEPEENEGDNEPYENPCNHADLKFRNIGFQER
jgi:hypothetical protein